MTRRPKRLTALEFFIMIASASCVIAIVFGIWRLVPRYTASPPMGKLSVAVRTKTSALSLQPG
jgi:hypothetical protein